MSDENKNKILTSWKFSAFSMTRTARVCKGPSCPNFFANFLRFRLSRSLSIPSGKTSIGTGTVVATTTVGLGLAAAAARFEIGRGGLDDVAVAVYIEVVVVVDGPAFEVTAVAVLLAVEGIGLELTTFAMLFTFDGSAFEEVAPAGRLKFGAARVDLVLTAVTTESLGVGGGAALALFLVAGAEAALVAAVRFGFGGSGGGKKLGGTGL